MERNERVILIVKLIMVAVVVVLCGTDDSQSTLSTEISSHQETFWEEETTTSSPRLEYELTTLPVYTTNPTTNTNPLLVPSTTGSTQKEDTPPAREETTYFSTTDQVKKFTTENIVVVVTSETELERTSPHTTAYSRVDEKEISSCQDIQAKKFDFINLKNLTDVERSTKVVGVVLPLTVDLVEWFHAYDYNFRNSIASILNGGNVTSVSSENDLKHFIEVGGVVYVAPTPLSNGTHISVCFVLKLKNESEEYMNATAARPIIIKEQETLSKEFELPSLSVFIGCPTHVTVQGCSNKASNDHVAIIVCMTITVLVIIIVIGYLHVRGQAERRLTLSRDTPDENVNDIAIPCSSRADVPYNRDLCHRPVQRGRRRATFHSAGEHSKNHSSSKPDGQRNLQILREERKVMGKKTGDDTRIEVTFM